MCHVYTCAYACTFTENEKTRACSMEQVAIRWVRAKGAITAKAPGKNVAGYVIQESGKCKIMEDIEDGLYYIRR